MHVLIVEDSIPAMVVEKMLMENLNCKVDSVSTGKEAVDLVQKNHSLYNMILMDLGLPDFNGIEAVKLIREYEALKKMAKIPIIAVTGNADPEQHEVCLNTGMNEVIVKPLTKESAASLLTKFSSS